MKRRTFVKSGGVACLLALSGCAETSADPSSQQRETQTAETGLTTVKGTGKLADSEAVHSGWIHLVRDRDRYDFTFDVRIAHDSKTGVKVNLPQSGSGTYELSLTKAEGESDPPVSAKPNSGDREYGTRIRGSASLAAPLDLLRVVSRNEELVKLDKQGGVGQMRQLSDPVSWS
jgi:hypothetical protein